jgi:hypothetical protein
VHQQHLRQTQRQLVGGDDQGQRQRGGEQRPQAVPAQPPAQGATGHPRVSDQDQSRADGDLGDHRPGKPHQRLAGGDEADAQRGRGQGTGQPGQRGIRQTLPRLKPGAGHIEGLGQHAGTDDQHGQPGLIVHLGVQRIQQQHAVGGEAATEAQHECTAQGAVACFGIAHQIPGDNFFQTHP